MSGWRVRSCGIATVLSVAGLLGGCGGGSRQDASEPSGNFPVQVTAATFPAAQRLAQQTELIIEVRNAGTKTIPNVAVSICNVTCRYPAPAGESTSAEAFGQDISGSYLAAPSRSIWIVDKPPGPCTGSAGYSCVAGGQGGAVTAYANTWAMGALRPGATARFRWGVTAVRPGAHVVAWEVAAGLNGRAKAVLSGGGGSPSGTFHVQITNAPEKSYVTGSGQVVPQP